MGLFFRIILITIFGLTAQGCASTPTVKRVAKAECPHPQALRVAPIPPGFFPDAPVVDSLPPESEWVQAIYYIRAIRDLTNKFNENQANNAQSINEYLSKVESSYNEYLEARKKSCDTEPDKD